MSTSNLANGGRILVDQLVAEGVDRIFGVPGESYLAVLDALYDTPEIAYHLCRQEGGAAMMADAYGKLTGRHGICFVIGRASCRERVCQYVSTSVVAGSYKNKKTMNNSES